MKKINALLLTPVAFIAILVFAIILAVVLFFLAINPLFWLGIVGIAAIVGTILIIVAAIYAFLFIFGGIYYALRDTGESFQRTPSNNYSIEDEKEMGRKQQKVN